MVDLLKHVNNLYFLVLLISTFSKTSLSTRILNPYVIKKWKEYKRNLTLEQEKTLSESCLSILSSFVPPSSPSFILQKVVWLVSNTFSWIVS